MREVHVGTLPAGWSLGVASMMKMEWVLEIARADPTGFLIELQGDAFRALSIPSLDLSTGEILGLIDVVCGSSLGATSPNLEDLRDRWQLIVSTAAPDHE
jgi:hypothetical protein